MAGERGNSTLSAISTALRLVRSVSLFVSADLPREMDTRSIRPTPNVPLLFQVRSRWDAHPANRALAPHRLHSEQCHQRGPEVRILREMLWEEYHNFFDDGQIVTYIPVGWLLPVLASSFSVSWT